VDSPMTRRSPGEGTVYRQADGKWVAEVQLPNNHLGRRRRRKRIATTRREAERLRRGLLADLEAGRIELDGSVTVTDWCETWLAGAARLTCKERTVAGYKYALDRWVLPHVGRYQLRHLHVGHIGTMQTSLMDAGLSVSTVRVARRVLSSALSHAVMSRHIAHNPVKDIRAPRYPDGERPMLESFTEEQARHLLAVCKDHPDTAVAAFVTIGLILGMRRGEILGLRLEDIDWEEGHLSINQALNQNYLPAAGGGWMTELGTSTPKTRHSHRDLSMPPSVRSVVLRLQATRDGQRQMAGDDWQETGFLFCSKNGKPFWPSNLRKRYQRLLGDAGVPKLSIHALRHTFATVCFLNEIPAEQIQTAAGHSSIRTTKDMYANYLPQLATKAINALSEVLDPDAGRHHLEVVKLDERKGA
jgi:integrase